MAHKVIFVTGTEKYKTKKVTVSQWIFYTIVAVLFIAFIYRPDWFVIPPGIKIK